MTLRTICVLAAATAALPLAACTQTADSGTGAATGSGGRVAAPAATVVGKPVDCVLLRQIRDTKVWDDNTIDFRMIDGTVYRNTLPNRCSGLGFEQRFAYKTSIGQLCSVDTITVLQTGSSIPGPTCGLGPFVPVKLAPR